MKPLLLLALFLAPILAFAQPSTLKEVLAVEREWQVVILSNKEKFRPGKPPAPVKETVAVFLRRVASAQSDTERRHAAELVRMNGSVLAKTLAVADATKLRDVLDRIAKAPSAAAADQAELKRLLDAAK